MVELEQLNEFRFYKLIPTWQKLCTNIVDNLYHRVNSLNAKTKFCYQLLRLHMVDGSINLICPSCHTQYDITRKCNVCERKTTFDDVTCDTCEPTVIDITTWKVSIVECDKAIKKINRAFKQDLVTEEEWKAALKFNVDEREQCEKNLRNEGISLQSTS